MMVAVWAISDEKRVEKPRSRISRVGVMDLRFLDLDLVLGFVGGEVRQSLIDGERQQPHFWWSEMRTYGGCHG